MLNIQFPWLVFQISSRVKNFQKMYRIDSKDVCDVDSELLELAGEIDDDMDVLGPDQWGSHTTTTVALAALP
jgi:hypothetical protein